MTVLNTVRTAIEKRVAYARTRNEIAKMPRDLAHDVGIFREDAAKIAAKAVYG